MMQAGSGIQGRLMANPLTFQRYEDLYFLRPIGIRDLLEKAQCTRRWP
ncbi:hypothetical protein TRIP_B10145 [uncultured Desulfatiglans sp.]|nr:hypothetical protein TRIP_B10145 [uncultured Desulfatiglans sp.]